MSDGHRCRWHEDPGGRCGDPVAFPAAEEAPPFCARHLLRLEPWIRSRAAQGGSADRWIAWAARRARDSEDAMRAAGIIGASRSIAERRAVALGTPERRLPNMPADRYPACLLKTPGRGRTT